MISLLCALALGTEGFQSPPAPIHDILTAPQPQSVSFSPDSQWMVYLDRPAMPSLADLAEPVVKVAGMKINPATNGPARAYAYTAIGVKRLGDKLPVSIELPDGAKVRDLIWSPEGLHLAFTNTEAEGISLWVLAIETQQTRQLTGPVLNAAYGRPCDWMNEGELACKVVPTERGPAPEEASVPVGPLVEENLGRKTPARTYTNLLQSPHDEALFEHYLTATVEKVDLQGERTPLTEALIVDEVAPSPDGAYLLVSTLHSPWSYHVPASRFPSRTVVMDSAGEEVMEVATLPLADAVPMAFGSVRAGRRTVGWRQDQPSTLFWVEALDGGDAGAEATERDAVYQLPAPFAAEPSLLWTSELRFGGLSWGREDTALAYEWWYNDRTVRTWRIDPSQVGGAPTLVHERNYQDAYADPGDPITARNRFGRQTLRFAADGTLFLSGRGASAEGVYPFLDRWDLESGETTRLWKARDPYFETVVKVVDDRRFITRRQSREEPPNYVERRIGQRRGAALTAFPDPAPQLAGLEKRLITYERADGVQLSASVYLPPGWKPEHGRLPTLFWAYPSEFKSRDTAGQVTTSENTFSRPQGSSVLFLLTQGYAIVSNPTMPIIGEGEVEPNDTYVEQLVMSAEAAVQAAVDEGFADPDRLAIGGHSYGAFTAANLLAHTDLFKAGVARSGAYNRTLTPFGFQSEQRSFWEATEVYMTLSPFTHAASINEPLLLIHGESDPNPGTYPVQSERMFEAMKGLGGTARWVVLPLEEHGYRSLEGVGHMHWEMSRWLDLWVRGKEPTNR